jgi:benzoylformate decarboxylase
VLQINADANRIGRHFLVTRGLIGHAAGTLRALNDKLANGGSDYSGEAARRNAELDQRHAAAATARAAALEKLKDTDPMSPARALEEIAGALPGECIVVDESITTSLEVGGRLEYRRPGDYYGARGGGIGQGIAGALGVQIAHPDRPVLAVSGDGSAMYSIQAFWTAAHHQLPIVFVILSNREYRVLKHNLDIYRQRFDVASNKPYPHMDLTAPGLDFAAMASGMGVRGELVSEPEAIAPALEAAFAGRQPFVIEIVISGKP